VTHLHERKCNQVLQPPFAELAVDERHFIRQLHIEEDATDGGFEEHVLDLDHVGMQNVLASALGNEIDQVPGEAQLDWCLGCNHTSAVGLEHVFGRRKGLAAPLGHIVFGGQIIHADHHVLRRHCQRPAARRRQDVAR